MQHKVLFADTWKMSNMFKHSYMQASMSNDILGTVSINKAKNKLDFSLPITLLRITCLVNKQTVYL